jgi:hypothetical protein
MSWYICHQVDNALIRVNTLGRSGRSVLTLGA